MHCAALLKVLSLVACLFVWTLASPESDAVSPRKECVQEDCQPENWNCKEVFRSQFREEKEDCAGGERRKDRRRCRRNERRTFRSQMRLCVGAFRDCKTCCRTARPQVCLLAAQEWCYISCVQELPGCLETFRKRYLARKREIREAYGVCKGTCREERSTAFDECRKIEDGCRVCYHACKDEAYDDYRACYGGCKDQYREGRQACREEYAGNKLECRYEFTDCEVCCSSEDPSVCAFAVCGDGEWGDDEQCDDGNFVDGDGCSASCEVE